MSKVKDVQDAIEIMEGFFKAYGKFSDIQLLKLISLFEVRCIMFMFNKRSPSRTTYASIKEIMVSVDGMARLYYDKLPVMPMLAAAGAAATAAADEPASKKRKNDSGSFRQVGKVSDDELKAKGFTVGVLIERADPNNKEQFKITQLNADGATISVELVNTDDAEPKPKAKAKAVAKTTAELELTLKRSDLHAYNVVRDDPPVFITNIVPLVENVGMIRLIVEGAVKDICLKEMLKSSEADCIVMVKKGVAHVCVLPRNLALVSSLFAQFHRWLLFPRRPCLGPCSVRLKLAPRFLAST